MYVKNISWRGANVAYSVTPVMKSSAICEMLAWLNEEADDSISIQYEK